MIAPMSMYEALCALPVPLAKAVLVNLYCSRFEDDRKLATYLQFLSPEPWRIINDFGWVGAYVPGPWSKIYTELADCWVNNIEYSATDMAQEAVDRLYGGSEAFCKFWEKLEDFAYTERHKRIIEMHIPSMKGKRANAEPWIDYPATWQSNLWDRASASDPSVVPRRGGEPDLPTMLHAYKIK